VALVPVTVAATVLVVLLLAPAARHTTTRLVLAPTWNLPSLITPHPLPLSLRPSNSNHPRTPQKVAPAKVHAAAMVVLRQLEHSRVLTVEHRQRPSGVATTSETTFATLVVRRSILFKSPPLRLHKMSLSPHCFAGTFPWGGDLVYLIRLRNTSGRAQHISHLAYFVLVVFTTAVVNQGCQHDRSVVILSPSSSLPLPFVFLSENNRPDIFFRM